MDDSKVEGNRGGERLMDISYGSCAGVCKRGMCHKKVGRSSEWFSEEVEELIRVKRWGGVGCGRLIHRRFEVNKDDYIRV